MTVWDGLTHHHSPNAPHHVGEGGRPLDGAWLLGQVVAQQADTDRVQL